MPRRSSPNNRDKVLATALHLFTSNGYFNTSMRDITRESGVSTGSVYHYFKDKEGVGIALYHQLVERMEQELMLIFDQHESPHDRCRATVELLFDITQREPDVMAFMLYLKHREFLPGEPPVCSSRPFELMRAMVEQGMESGAIRRIDVMTAAACLFGGPIRLITLALDGMLEKPLNDYLDETWGCAWDGVRVP